LYNDGNYGIEKDEEVAMQWFQLAAAQNDPSDGRNGYSEEEYASDFRNGYAF